MIQVSVAFGLFAKEFSNISIQEDGIIGSGWNG